MTCKQHIAYGEEYWKVFYFFLLWIFWRETELEDWVKNGNFTGRILVYNIAHNNWTLQMSGAAQFMYYEYQIRRGDNWIQISP